MPQMHFEPARNSKATLVDQVIDSGVLQIKHSAFNTRTEKPIILAGFDVDGTLVLTKSGATFARGGHDWRILPGVRDLKTRLGQLQKEHPHHKVICVLFTNQGGAIARKNSKSYINLKTKLTGVCNSLDCVDVVYAALKADPLIKNKYRKPSKGMMRMLTTALSSSIDYEKSFYVGDAAGRPQDHSTDDINFAKNAGLHFYTPEQFFGDDFARDKEPAEPVDAVASDDAGHAVPKSS